MGSDLSKPLDQNLDTDLATGLGGTRSSLPFEGDALLHWTTESGLVEGAVGKVASWTDRIAGVTVSQAVEGNQPTYGASDLFRGATVINFDAAGEVLEVNDSPDMPVTEMNTGDWTIVIVGRRPDDSASSTLADFSDSSSGTPDERIRCRASNGRLLAVTKLEASVGSQVSSSTVGSGVAGGMQVFGFGGVASTSTVLYSRIGGVETIADPENPQNLDSLRIGNRRGGNEVNSGIVEIAVYDHALTSDEWTTVLAHFDAKYRPAEAPLRHGAAHWWDPTTGITEDVGVSAWSDRIGGVSVAQGTGAAQPTLVDSIRTGHQMLDFDGSSDVLSAAVGSEGDIFESQNPFTIYSEFSSENSSASTKTLFSAYLDGSASTEETSLRFGGSASLIQFAYAGGGSSTVRNGAEVPKFAGRWAYGSLDSSGTVATRVMRESESSTGPTAANPTSIDTFEVGGRSGILFEGQIGHVVVLARDLLDAEHADFQAWLESQWTAAEVPTRLGALWDFDPTTGITLSGSDVSAHVDKISAFTLSQGTEANQPLFVAASGSTPAYLDYDGSATNMVATDADLLSTLNSDTFESWLAMHPVVDNSGTPAGAFDSTSTLIRHRHVLTASHNAQSHDGTTIATAAGTAIDAGEDGWARATFGGTSSRSVQTSAGSEGTDTTALVPVTTIDTWCQGRRNRSGTPDQYYDGRLYRDIGFARALGADDRADMEAFLEALLGI